MVCTIVRCGALVLLIGFYMLHIDAFPSSSDIFSRKPWVQPRVASSTSICAAFGRRRGGIQHTALERALAKPRQRWRQSKFERILRDELSDIITRCRIKASRYPPMHLFGASSIASIDLNTDFSMAKVYVSTRGNASQKRQMFIWLNENVKQVRYQLHHNLRKYKKLPVISFHLYDTYFSDFASSALTTTDVAYKQPRRPPPKVSAIKQLPSFFHEGDSA